MFRRKNMIIWCSFCQKYIGEREPLQDYSLTHGICVKCKSEKKYQHTDSVDDIQEVKEFFDDLFASATNGEYLDTKLVLNTGKKLGIDPVSLFFGLIQPILWRIGEEYEKKGECVIYNEHLFTAFAENILREIAPSQDHIPFLKSTSDILLTCTEGNYHTLGVKSLAIQLKKMGYSCDVIYPGLPFTEIKSLLSKKPIKIIGLTISTDEQWSKTPLFLKEVIEEGLAEYVVLGGQFFKQNTENFFLPSRVVAFDRLDLLYRFLDKNLQKNPM